MKQRCTNARAAKFASYGGAGITVCEEWLSFDGFVADMGERPDGTTIDRIDGTKGYFRGNCRWATATEQQNNLRSNRMIDYVGEALSLSALARKLGVEINTLAYRIDAGWPVEDWGMSAWQGNRH